MNDPHEGVPTGIDTPAIHIPVEVVSPQPYSEIVHADFDERELTPEEERVHAILREVGGDIEKLARRYVAKENEVEAYARNEATGLEGARRLNEHLTQKLHEAASQGGKVGIVFIDLKGLKKLNEMFGHPGGNELLAVVGQWLLGKTRQKDATNDGMPRKKDQVFHPHGDEFVAVLEDYKLDDESELDRRADQDEEDLDEALQAKAKTMKRQDGKTDDEPIVTGATVALVISDGNESAKQVLTRASLKCNQKKENAAKHDPRYKAVHMRTQTPQDGFIAMILALLFLLIAVIILVFMRVVNAST